MTRKSEAGRGFGSKIAFMRVHSVIVLMCLSLAIFSANAQRTEQNKSAPEKGRPGAAAVDLSGSWSFILTSTHPDRHTVRFAVVFKHEGDKISGTSGFGNKFEGTISGSDVVFKPLPFLGDDAGHEAVGRGKIESADHITGTIDVPPGNNPAWTWEFIRDAAH